MSPLTNAPDGWSSHLEWTLWRAHLRRLRTGIAGLVGIGLACTTLVSAWPLVLVPVLVYGLRAWRKADERKILAQHAPEPTLPSELEDWDTALRMRTGKDQAQIDRTMREIAADEATRRYLERKQRQQ